MRHLISYKARSRSLRHKLRYMADDELKELLGGEAESTPEEEKAAPVAEEPKEDPEVKAKAEQLANLNKAIEEAQTKLKDIRKERKQVKPIEEEELPKINMEEPSAKAWDKHIRETVAPSQDLLERAKDERRKFALRQFLADKPALAKDADRIKQVMATYDRIKDATELTTEGILEDLDRAYAAEHHTELLQSRRQARIDQAREDMLYADPAVSRGSTTYQIETPRKRVYTEEERQILAQWERSGAAKLDE